MLFKYSAKTRETLTTRKGEIEAPDQSSALKQLQSRGLIVYSLILTKDNFSIFETFKRSMGISLTDKVRFTDNLAKMLIAGLALTKSLEILIAQTSKKKFTELLQGVLNDVEAGSQLSVALEKYSKVFPESYVSLVRAGEVSGKLSDVMEQLAQTMEKERQFRGKLSSAMVYPASVMVIMVGVFVILMVFVIPQMSDIYKLNDVTLPITTQIMIKISDFMVYYWYYLILIIAGIFFGIKYFYSTPFGKYFIDGFLLKVPAVGGLLRNSAMVEISRTLALLSNAGVNIVDALSIVKNTVSNARYKESVEMFIEDVKHGYPLSQSMMRDVLIPTFASQMVVVGEETGTMGDRLSGIANFYEGEVDKFVKNISTLIEPIIMVILGIMVATLVISVIMPIYQLTTQIGG
jgi:type IV pilus assembly protein PilC